MSCVVSKSALFSKSGTLHTDTHLRAKDVRRRLLVCYTLPSFPSTTALDPNSTAATQNQPLILLDDHIRPHLRLHLPDPYIEIQTHTRTSNLNAQIPFLTHLPLIPLACSSLVGTADR